MKTIDASMSGDSKMRARLFFLLPGCTCQVEGAKESREYTVIETDDKEKPMDVNGIASLATGMADARLTQAIGIAVFKKTLEAQSAGALALLNALPAPSTPNLPPHLGQNVDTTA